MMAQYRDEMLCKWYIIETVPDKLPCLLDHVQCRIVSFPREIPQLRSEGDSPGLALGGDAPASLWEWKTTTVFTPRRFSLGRPLVRVLCEITLSFRIKKIKWDRYPYNASTFCKISPFLFSYMESLSELDSQQFQHQETNIVISV